MARQIKKDQSSNIRHNGVRCPRHQDPFQHSEGARQIFVESLKVVRTSHVVPKNLGVRAEEWEDGYPSYELIPGGRRGKNELRVPLPYDIWHPRAVLWAQALSVLTCLMEI
jgi:hypothetical protein